MRTFLFGVMAIASIGVCFGQQQPQLVLPHLSGDRFNEQAAASAINDPVTLYQNRREAAAAAFQAGYAAETVDRKRSRAMAFFLIALKRDPGYGKALFNMGVLCTQDERWQDAARFYEAAQRADLAPNVAKIAAEEAARLRVIAQLESTPEGKRRRAFDIQLVAAVYRAKNTRDPVPALENAKLLIKTDGTRWEPLALAGILQASLGALPETVKDLEDAAKLAPARERPQIEAAADVARRQSKFEDLVKQADGLWDKQQYGQAANLYSEAWENSPGSVNVGLQAATGFLMGDQVAQAVDILSRLRDGAPREVSSRAAAMLAELGAVSEDAKREAGRTSAGGGETAATNPAERIRSLFNILTTPQMELSAKAAPSLVKDDAHVTPIEDKELTGGHDDLLLLSTDSLFARYQAAAASGSPASPPADARSAVLASPSPAPATTSVPAPPDRPAPLAALPQAERPATAPVPPPATPPAPPANAIVPSAPANAIVPPAPPQTVLKRAAKGSQQMFTINSNPSGATVVLDSTADLSCRTPCEVPLSLGRHDLRANLAGYREVLKIFNVEKKSSSLELAFEAKRGTLAVASETPGLAVFINGQKSERVTPASLELAEGSYEVGVEKDGKVQSQKIAIKDGTFLSVTF